MPTKTNTLRLDRAMMDLPPRGRVVAALSALSEGEIDTFQALGRAAPMKSYTEADVYESDAISIACGMSNIIDACFFEPMMKYYRAEFFACELREDLAKGIEIKHEVLEKLEVASAFWFQQAQSIAVGARLFADKVGLPLEVLFPRASVRADSEFDTFIGTARDDTEDARDVCDQFLHVWNQTDHVLAVHQPESRS